MQRLYVVLLEVTNAKGEGHAPDRPALLCMEHVQRWLAKDLEKPIPIDALYEKGAAELTPRYELTKRSAAWEHVAGNAYSATRLERRDEHQDGSEFVTRITVGEGPEGVRVFITMGRQHSGSVLSPVSQVPLHQPNLISQLIDDNAVRVTVSGQLQTGRFHQVRGPEQIEVLAEALRQPNRLPVLLIHSRTPEALSAAKRAARKLIGLAAVVTLDFRSVRHLNELHPTIKVPYAGALIVWADISAPPVMYDSDLVSAADPDRLRAEVMSAVAPISVLTRGRDEIYERARRAAKETERASLAARTIDAASSGDIGAELEAMRAERDRALADLDFATNQWEMAVEEGETLRAEMTKLTATKEQLKLALLHNDSDLAPETDPASLDNAPRQLICGDRESLEMLCEHLERATDGRITFTPSAITAWTKANRYPTTDIMCECLIKLARVAYDLYDGSERAIAHLDTWIRESYDLKISLQDSTLPKKVTRFYFEGSTLSREPHVKVNDGVPAWAVGRIYFALDKAGQRVIVDHIGLHL